jgi:hypothetical protein
MQLLYDNGADVHAVTSSGMSGLFCAAKFGKAGAIKKLIKFGVNVCIFRGVYTALLKICFLSCFKMISLIY